MANGERQRIVWIDHARGMGILLVVVGHALLGTVRSGLTGAEGAEAHVAAVIYAFHMPLFFLLAGTTQGLSRRKGLPGLGAGLFWTLIYPYLLWSLIWIGLKGTFAGLANTPVTVESPVEILWQPVDHFWFLFVLLPIRIAWALVEATGSRLVRNAAVVLPLALAFAGNPFGSQSIPAYIPFWAAFYGVGVVLSDAPGRLGRGPLVAIAAASAVVLAAVLAVRPMIAYADYDALRTIGSLAGSLGVIALAVLLSRSGLLFRTVGFLGEASLAIYLTHPFFAVAARVLLGRLDLLDPWLLVVVATVTGIAVPAAVHALGLALAREGRGSPLRWIGFGPLARSAYVAPAGFRLPIAGRRAGP